MSAGSASVEKVRQEHHITLDEAIQALNVLKNQICRLRDRINGTPEPEGKDGNVRENPSLAAILEGGPQEIREYHNSCRDLVNEIEGLLFG